LISSFVNADRERQEKAYLKLQESCDECRFLWMSFMAERTPDGMEGKEVS
jgi:hypothetical protein